MLITWEQVSQKWAIMYKLSFIGNIPLVIIL